MKIFFQYLSLILLLVASVTAGSTFYKYSHTPLRSLVYILWLSVVIHWGAMLLSHMEYDSTWLYNIGMNIEILLYGYIFYKYQKNKPFRYFIVIGGVLFETMFIVNYLMFSKSLTTSYQVLPLAIGSIVLSTTVILFFYEMFQSKAILSITDFLVFWVGIGLLFYYVIPLPLLIGSSVFDRDNSVASLYYIPLAQHIAASLMFILLIYGFLWKSKAYI